MSSIDWKRMPRNRNLSFRKRKKSAGAISGEYGGCSMIFVDFLVFTRLSFWRKFRSFGTSRAATRFSYKQSFKMIRIDSWDQSEANLPPHLDRFWMHCITHMHVFLIKLIHRKPSVTFPAIPHTKFHLQCKIWDKFFVRYSYLLGKSRNTLEINWQHRALWTN